MVKGTKKKARVAARPSKQAFGPISTINTAPVSIGNSVRGSQPRISQTKNGARVVGRDFSNALSSTAAAITGWELIGGFVVTPASLPSSALRNFCLMYNRFKVNKLVVHYITSSPTSQAGDVLFYYQQNSKSPMLDYSNSGFLPTVLSDPTTTIGPQWTNHSISVQVSKEFKTTLYGLNQDTDEDKEGVLYCFSKTNSANSPGYILVDYDIEFKELALNPRAGSYPIARINTHFACLTNTSAITASSHSINWGVSSGKTITGATSLQPPGWQVGDIYKVYVQATATPLVNTAWSGTPTPTMTNLLKDEDDQNITLDDGYTLYARFETDGTMWLFSELVSAIMKVSNQSIEWQTTITTPSVNLCVAMEFLFNPNSTLMQSSY